MSWFSSTFSRSGAPSPEQDEVGKVYLGDEGGSPRRPLVGGTGVKDEFSELTKNLTRQLWGAASFLAPPPVGCPKHMNTSQTETPFLTIAGNSEDPQAAEDAVVTEKMDVMGSASVVGVAGLESRSLAESQKSLGEISNLSASGSPSASGDKLIGFRSDLAELRGTMATGFSRIQTVIRAVTHNEDVDEDMENDAAEDSLADGSVSGLPRNLEDETSRNSGLSFLLKPLLVSMSSFRERLPKSERQQGTPLIVGEHGEGDIDYKIQAEPTGQSSLADSFGGLSRFASSLIPYARDIVGEISGKDYLAVALTDEVVGFADNIALHPETWLDFPLPEEDDDDDFEMTELQQDHAKAVEELSSMLAAVHRELCPASVSDGRFWKIYFVLLHSRLNKEDAELLSTSQILNTRELLLQLPKEEPRIFNTVPTQSECEGLGLADSNLVHLPYEQVARLEHLKSMAESGPLSLMEEVSLDDTSHPKLQSSQETVSAATDVEEETHDSSSMHFAALRLDDEESDVDAWLEDEGNDEKETAEIGAAGSIDDVSFSDLEDDDGECSKEEDGSHAVKRDLKSANDRTSDPVSHGDAPCVSKPEGDWLTVNIEDVASPISSSP